MTALFPDVHKTGIPYGRLHETQCKEQIGLAYLRAVVTAARCKIDRVEIDDNSVDAVLTQDAVHELYDGARLDVQMKCTSKRLDENGGDIHWSLSRKNYVELSNERRYDPAILVVLFVPESIENWVSQDAGSLSISHCAYWASLRGSPEIPDVQQTKTVQLSRTNVFDVGQLLSLMKLIGDGGRP